MESKPYECLEKVAQYNLKTFINGCSFCYMCCFKALTQKIDSCQSDDNKAYTEKYQKYIDCGYAHKLVCCYDDKFSKPIQLYRGEKAVYKFLRLCYKKRNIAKSKKRSF